MLLALSWTARWRGVRRGHIRVLLPVAAVHARGLASPLSAVGIDKAGVVIAVKRLDPGSFLRIPGASWMLEQPVDEPLPASGMVLSIYPRGDARETHSVRDTDWQSE